LRYTPLATATVVEVAAIGRTTARLMDLPTTVTAITAATACPAGYYYC